MPKVKLASQRVANVSPGQPARGQMISAGSVMGIQRPYIPVDAAKVQYIPAPVPKIPIDTTLQSIAQFSENFNRAAFQYQQREANVWASEAAMKYREEVSKAFLGYSDESGNYVPGYKDTMLLEASSSYGDFQNFVDSKMNEIAQSLPESARQKALLSLSSIRNTYLNKAAVHRAGQLKKAEENVLYEKRQDAIREIAADPASITRVDPTVGLTGKDKFLGYFPDKKAGKEAWSNLIKEVTEKIYLEQGLEKAQQFYNEVAQEELIGSPKISNQVLSNIRRWEHEAVRAYNSTEDLRIKREKQAKERLFESTQAKLEADRLQGKLYSEHELGIMVRAGVLDPQYARTYANQEYGHYKWVPDYEELNDLDNRILASAKNNFRDPVTGKKIDLLVQSMHIDNVYKNQMIEKIKALKNPDFEDKLTRGHQAINAWFTRPNYVNRLYGGEIAIEKQRAQDELFRRLKGGEDLYQILGDMENRYNPTVVSWDRLAPLWDGTKPASGGEVKTKQALLEQMLAAGQITAETYRARKIVLLRYLKSINQRLQNMKGKESKN